MVLDRKTKTIDADLELVEDRAKQSKIMFLIFFIVGWVSAGLGLAIIPYKYDEIIIGFGICMLIFATWMLQFCFFESTIFYLKRKEEKNK